jgi:hypothetical protein
MGLLASDGNAGKATDAGSFGICNDDVVAAGTCVS